MSEKEKEALVRRYKSNIRLNGRYYIFFGLWAAVRSFMMLTLDDSILKEAFAEMEVEEAIRGFVEFFVIVVLILIMLCILAIHFFVGISAIRYSRGKSKNRIFLLIAAIDIIVIVLSVPNDFPNGIRASAIAAAMVDITQVIMLGNMLYSVIRIKSLTEAAKE